MISLSVGGGGGGRGGVLMGGPEVNNASLVALLSSTTLPFWTLVWKPETYMIRKKGACLKRTISLGSDFVLLTDV